MKNLKKCKASCCKRITITVTKALPDTRDYYEKFGFNCKKQGRGYVFWIEHPCKQLTSDNKCKLHGTNEKPRYCRMLNEKNKSNFVLTEGCIYG